MGFLAIVMKITETLFSIGLEITVVALSKCLRHFYGTFLSLDAEGTAQITKIHCQKSAGFEIRNRCLKGGEILIVRFHARNMARPALKIIWVKRAAI